MLDPPIKKLISPESIDRISRANCPKAVLRCMLSLEFTRPRECCRDAPNFDHYRPIGCGSCGRVYQIGNSYGTLKRAIPNTPLSPDCKISNDLYMHKKVLQAFDAFKENHKLGEIKVTNYVEIPECPSFISKDDTNWWAKNSHLFPFDEQYPEDILYTAHIPPLEERITNALINVYCDEPLQDTARSQDSNRDCLIRPYLGKSRGATRRLKKAQARFGLRNFPLCLDQMQDLRLDTASYALVMADALAVMHWSAKIDAADVEFVLGRAYWEDPMETPSLREQSATHMYLLDFNQCQHISMDEAGVDQAVKRFFDNDPYYPRPHTGNKGADVDWNIFSLRYVQISTFLRGLEMESNDSQDFEPKALPTLFLAKVKEGMLEREEKKQIAATRSLESLDTSTDIDSIEK